MKWWDLILFFECWVLSQLFHSPVSPSSRGSLTPLHFLPLGRYHLHTWGCLYFFQQSWFQIMIHPAWHLAYSTYKLNKQGVNIQPWSTPFPVLNQSIIPCLVLIVASWSAYRFLQRQVGWSGITIFLRIFHSLLWSTQSKALAQPIKQNLMFFWNSLAFSMIQQILAIWSLVPPPFIIQLVHLEVLGSHTNEAFLEGSWVLPH